MMIDLLGPAFVWRLGWTLLHSLWQIAVVAVAAAAILSSLQRRSPQLRYAVAYASLGSIFLPLVVTFAVVRSDGSLWSGQASSARPAVTSLSGKDFAADPISSGAATLGSDGLHGAQAASSQAHAEAIAVTPRWLAQSVPWLVVGWIVGFVLVSLWNLGGWFAALRLRRLTTAPVAAHLQTRLAEMAASMRVASPVQLLESMLVETPMVIGCLRPVILLPATLHTSITAVELDALLAHELAHIRRHDYLANLFQTLAEAVLFYHPAIWWLSGRIRTEREYCCDEMATAHCGRVEYARALFLIAQGGRAPRLAMAAASGRASALEKRLRRVLGAPVSDGSSWLGGLLLILSVAILLAAGWSFALADEGQAGAPATPAARDVAARDVAAPMGFSDEQKITLHQGRQEAFAGIRVELDNREGTAAVRFVDTYAVQVDAGLWSTKSAADMWLEYQQGAFAILPHERDAWLSLDSKFPIVIYLGGVGLAKIESVTAHDTSLTAVLCFKLLEFPLGVIRGSRAPTQKTAHSDAEDVTNPAGSSTELLNDYRVIHQAKLTTSVDSEQSYLDLDRGTAGVGQLKRTGAAPPRGSDLASSLHLSDSRTFATVSLAAIPVEDAAFDLPQPDQAAIRQIVEFPSSSGAIVGGARRTWYFRTAEHNVGVMQISPIPEEPQHILVRWRLLPPAMLEPYAHAAAAGVADAPGREPGAAPPKRIAIQEDPEHAARLATQAHQDEKKREVFYPTTRKSGKTSWSNAFPSRFPQAKGGHMVIVQAHLGDRWPVRFAGQSEPLFTAEVLDGYDAAITLRIEHADEVLMLTLARDRSRQIIVGDQRCRIAYASTHVAESQEPPLVDYATIFVEILPKSTDSPKQSRPQR